MGTNGKRPYIYIYVYVFVGVYIYNIYYMYIYICIYIYIHIQLYIHINFRIFLSPNPVVVNKKRSQNRVCLVGKTLVGPVGIFCAILEATNAHVRQNSKMTGN